jgi:hypothetical protein
LLVVAQPPRSTVAVSKTPVKRISDCIVLIHP